MKSSAVRNGQCSLSGTSAVGHIIRYGFGHNEGGKALTLPAPDLWEDVLLQHAGHLTIDCNTVAPPLMKLPP